MGWRERRRSHADIRGRKKERREGGREGGKEGGREEALPWDGLAVHLEGEQYVPPSVQGLVDGDGGLVRLLGHVGVQAQEVHMGQAQLVVVLGHAWGGREGGREGGRDGVKTLPRKIGREGGREGGRADPPAQSKTSLSLTPVHSALEMAKPVQESPLTWGGEGGRGGGKVGGGERRREGGREGGREGSVGYVRA